MWQGFVEWFWSSTARPGVAVLVAMTVGPQVARAEDFTAGVVLEKMDVSERFTFVSGVIEGLAYARFKADGNETAGMGCIYDWFYEDRTSMAQIEEAFARYPDHLPGSVVAALLQLRCPP